MLPFLKDRHEGAMAGPVETMKRDSDEDGEDSYGMLDAIAEDLIDGIHKKQKDLIKGALEALIEHIQSEDMAQDEEQLA